MLDYLYKLATDKYRGFIPACIKVVLFIVSLLYGLTVRILIFLYRLKPLRVNCRVISIGNITLGGTGKTSLVEYYARTLQKQGCKLAILTRGYKRNSLSGSVGKLDYKTMGDEPYMLSRRLTDVPIIIDSDRVRAAKRAISEHGVDTVILDDGFQQWRLKKNSEILAIDATNPFGNRHLLPRGILREPLSSLRRVDTFVITKTNINPAIGEIKDFLIKMNPLAKILESVHYPVGFYKLGKEDDLFNAGYLSGRRVSLFSGIGDPDSFERLVDNLGMDIGLSFRFSDHHDYSQKDIDRIIKATKEKNIDTIVTTEKDAVRLQGFSKGELGRQLFVMRIELKIVKNE